MREIKIEKISLNIGVGKPGEELEKAVKLLGIITGAKPVKTSAKRRIPTWGLRPGLQIGTKVTIRGIKSVELLRELLKAKNNTLSVKNFDGGGNFSFGIHEYLDIPSIKYDPSIG
ncbi:MAG: 50S ribosomal protein L5, partial [Nanoarchaeota archaeon]